MNYFYIKRKENNVDVSLIADYLEITEEEYLIFELNFDILNITKMDYIYKLAKLYKLDGVYDIFEFEAKTYNKKHFN